MNGEPTTHAISQIGRYEILGTLARGGMATVYLARLAAAGGFAREFALKVIHPHLAAEKAFRQRLLEEARLASRVRHPNAVTTIDAGEDQGYAYLVLELIDGANLRQLMLHRSVPFSAAMTAGIVAQVARGLHALHTATSDDDVPLGMVHRDLSPHNVMIDRGGRAIVIDLGLAKAEGREDFTEVGVLAGKVPYMSPEQARIEPLDARSDVFALGIMLYQLTTGELPFGDTVSLPTLERVQRCELDKVHEGFEKYAVPKWLAEVILSCLKLEKDQRIQTAAELADVLEQELAHDGNDEVTIRRSLASLVEDTAGQLEEAAPEEPPLHPIVPAPARPQRFAFAARWLALGGVAASLGVAAMWARPTVPTEVPNVVAPAPRDGGSLAADGVPATRDALPATMHRTVRVRPEPAPAPAPDVEVSPPPTGEALVPPLIVVEMLEPMLEQATTAKPKKRRSGASTELKPNPYAQ